MRKISGRSALLQLGTTLLPFLVGLQILDAQYENGSLIGTIRDVSGATVPQATADSGSADRVGLHGNPRY